MKIGILTFHRALNYGAVLQCYALQTVLQSMGHNVFVIDYRQSYTERIRKIFSFSHLLSQFKRIRSVARYLKNTSVRYRKRKQYDEFVRNFFNLTSVCYNNAEIPSFPIYIIGSDQLWNDSILGNEFDPVFLGNFVKPANSEIYGYAISSSTNALERLLKNNQEVISRFSALSFREKQLKEMAEKFSKTNLYQCIDPTLLTEKETWLPLINKKWDSKNYVLVYQIRGDRNVKKKIREAASSYAKKYKLNIIDIDNDNPNYSVSDFVSLFYYARYIVTSSFHGVAFSLIFEKNFTSYVLNETSDVRYVDLLSNLNLSSRLVPVGESLCEEDIDYGGFSFVLNEYKSKSVEFLKKI